MYIMKTTRLVEICNQILDENYNDISSEELLAARKHCALRVLILSCLFAFELLCLILGGIDNHFFLTFAFKVLMIVGLAFTAVLTGSYIIRYYIVSKYINCPPMGSNRSNL